MLDGAEDAKVVKAAKHAVTNGADAAALAPLQPPPEVGTRPSELLPRLQVGVVTVDCHSRPCGPTYTLSQSPWAQIESSRARRRRTDFSPGARAGGSTEGFLKRGWLVPLEPSTRLVRPLVRLTDNFVLSSDRTLTEALLDL